MDSKNLFGTDGIRGTANQYPMTADIALKFATAAGGTFKEHTGRNKVVIAKDPRLSGYLLEPALVSGFVSTGMDVILVGPMPTPAVPMLIKSLRANLGVMISASHNPWHDNGLKLFDKNGYKLSDKVQNDLQDMILRQDRLNQFLATPELLGRVKRLEDAQGRYIEHVKQAFPRDRTLEGMRIVLDCANGAAYKVAPTIFSELGAEVITISNEPDGFNINRECGAMHPENLTKKVLETRADIGLALDGDADRIIICDEQGNLVSGDHVIAAIAKYMIDNNTLRGNALVSTQMANSALESHISKLGLNFHRSKVGDRYVFERMQEIGCNIGGEESGHIIIGDYSNTGDGIVAALHILAMLIDTKCQASTLSQLFSLNPSVIVNVSCKKDNPLEKQKVQSYIEDLKKKNENTRILVRKSGTEPVIRIAVEGETKPQIDKIASQIVSIIQQVAA